MSKKSQQLFIRVMCIILALLMAGSVLVSILSSTAGAVTQSDIDKLEDELGSIQQRLKEVRSQINSLEYDQSVALAKKQVLDSRIDLTQQLIDNLNEQIAEYNELIRDKAQEVADRQAEEDSQIELYKEHIRSMEENGVVSYYSIVFGAKDFSDMLSRIDVVTSLMSYDEQVYNDLVASRQATENAKAALEDTRATSESRRSELQQAEAELQEQQEEATALIATIQQDIDQARQLYDQVDKEEDAIKDRISKLEEELRKQNTRVVGTGSFQGPADSNVVTSGFGGRNTGISGASTNHKGIDIRAGYGANIYAADSGTVVTSELSSSYGNYIVISHGNGKTTLYGHMSRRLVKAGDTVKKGQIIGYAGATGVANGPHLHFEIWENGNRVNPLNYFKSGTYVFK